MELIYSNQLDGFDPERRYRNPEHFDKPEAGVTSVLVIGDWPSVVGAYATAGINVSVKEAEAGEIAALKAVLDAAGVAYRANASKESLENLSLSRTRPSTVCNYL